MNSALLPNVIIGGAPKCGTSSLYFWLSAHPEVYGSPKKRLFADKVNRFNASANVHEHDLDQYQAFFKGGEDATVRFEATAHYLYEKVAREHFSNWAHKPKVIFLFREPSKQMYSHYKMERYRTKRIDMQLSEYSASTNQRPCGLCKTFEGLMDAMPEGQVRFWAFEDLMSRKEAVMKEIAEYVGVDPNFYDGFDFEHRNESVAIKSGLFTN